MENQGNLVVSLLFLLFLNLSFGIYVPEDEQYQKPAYTSGIKTSYSRPSQVQVHHNYSKVYHQNTDGGYPRNSLYREDTSQRPYPMYNAHTYGNTPPRSERLTQVYVLNGTRIRNNENPIRRIVIYNTQKRTPKTEVYKSCPHNATGQFVYESSCNQFLNCWKGRGYVQNCAPGTLFNPKTLECDFPEKVQCLSGPRYNVLEKERSLSLVKQIGCPKGFTGLIPNYTDCSKFINCDSGIENFMNCPPGTLFDIDKNICDFSHKAKCFNKQNEILKEQKVDEKLDFETSNCENSKCSKKQLNYKSNEIRCPANADGLHSHPTDCSKFLNCAHGQTYIQDCAPGTLFNPNIKICDFPYNVKCQSEGVDSPVHQPGNSQHNGGYTDVPVYISSNHYGGGSSSQPTVNRDNWNTEDHYDGQDGNYDTTIISQNRDYGFHDSSTRPYNFGGSGANRNTWEQDQYLKGNTDNQYYNQNADTTGSNRGLHDIPIYHRPTQETGYYQPYQGSDSSYYQKPFNTGSAGISSYQQHNNNYYNFDSNQGQKGTYGGIHTNLGYDRKGTFDQTSASRGDNWGHNQYNPYDLESSTSGNTYNQKTWGPNHYYPVLSNYDRNYNKYNNSNIRGTYGQNSWGPNRDNTGSGNYNGSFTIYNSSSTRGIYGQNNWVPNQYNPGYSNYDGSNNRYNSSRTGGTYGHNTFGYNQGSNNYDRNWETVYRPSTTINQNRYDSSGASDYYGQNTWGRNDYNQEPSNYDRNQSREPLYTRGTTIYPSRGTVRYNNSGTKSIYGQSHWDLNNNHQGLTYSHGTVVDRSRGETAYNNVYGQHSSSEWTSQNSWQNNRNINDWNQERVIPNDNHVVNIGRVKVTTRQPYNRRPYEPFTVTTSKASTHSSRSVDYDDTFGISQSTKPVISGTTSRIVEKNWPPPFPSTDVNADYVFEDDETGGVSLEAENSIADNEYRQKGECGKSEFRCSLDKCISKTLVCNGVKDCPNGNDELTCLEYVSKFSVQKEHKLAILEKERWDNVSIATCALLCIETRKFQCRSFNYRKVDKTCFLTDTNEGLTGGLISYYPFDYYELISEKLDCSKKYLCNNRKCIERSQLCDGVDDCGDRMDEKGCKPQDFGYSIKLTGSKEKNEGHIEITAFGKTGYVCDDQFGIRDADVVCKELGFDMGAVEVKKGSYYLKNSTIKNPFYMMDDVSCIGNETKLMDCDFSGWGVHNCLGQEMVGVVCKTPQEKCPTDYWQCDTGHECLPLAFVCDGLLDCSDGSDERSQYCDAPTEVRLVNGSSRQEGRVEIKHHGTWGTICDDDFNDNAAKVICKHLGYKGSASVRKEAYFGAGSGPIWLDQVFCSGNESSIESCTHWEWGEHNCEHSEDVGVICSNIYEHERHSVVPLQQTSQAYPYLCGYRKDNMFNRDDDVHFRVVKGSLAKRGDYPWQAAIRVKGKVNKAVSHWCGAVIISEKFILTAAHCLMGYSKGAYVVVAGDYDVDEVEGTEQEAYIDDYYIHEDFRKGHKMNNDIALIKLKGTGFRLTDDVQAICLPENGTNYEATLNCTISGFGSIQSGKSAFSHQLRAGWVPIQKREICTMPHVYGDAMTDGMICAGTLDEGIDACDGDSGGPLACLNDGVFTLYGITSWGQHCGYANKPGVYVKISHYRKWIDDKFHKYSTS